MVQSENSMITVVDVFMLGIKALQYQSKKRKGNKKFISRFTAMEEKALAGGKKLDEMTLEEMDAIWNEIKRHTT